MALLELQRPSRPWYGCWSLVAAVGAALATLGITLVFWAAELGTQVSCGVAALGLCDTPAWLIPAQWIAWAGAAIGGLVSVAAAAREARSGERRRLARLAIATTLLCAAFVLVTVLMRHVSSTSD